jgi:hypothetical protein
MRSALGLPLPDSTLRSWSAHFCFHLEPLFLDADLALRLEPHALVMTRSEFNLWMRSQPLEYGDAYQPWNVRADFVAVLTPSEITALDPDVSLEVNAAQIRLKRGLSFPLGQAQGFGVSAYFLKRDRAEDSFLLRRDAWESLPEPVQFDWLTQYVSGDGHDCLSSSSLRDNSSLSTALESVGWLPHSSANCFATALCYGGSDPALRQNIARLWLQAETFERTLTARGFQEHPLTDAPLEPGAVIVWRNSGGDLTHACVSLGSGLVLNKNAQGWHAPRQILRLETVLEGWAEDGLEVRVFEPA